MPERDSAQSKAGNQSLLAEAKNAFSQEDYDLAESLCRQALTSRFTSFDCYQLLARIGERTKRLEFAVQMARKAVHLRPELLDAQRFLAELLSQARNYAEAATAWQKLISQDANDATACASLGSCYVSLGLLPEAISAYRQAVENAPDVATFHCDLGVCLMRLGRPSDAISEMEGAILADPLFTDAYLWLSKIWASMGEKERALKALTRAKELDSSGAQDQLRLASAFMEQGEFSEAEECFRSSIEQEPCLAKAHGLLGALLLQQGDFEAASSELRKAIELDPSEGAPYQLYTRSKRITEKDLPLIEQMKTLLLSTSSSEDRERLSYALGKAYDDIREYETAMGFFEEANRLAARNRRSNPFFSKDAYLNLVRENVRVFSSDFVASTSPGASISELPVLIVGMMRSGTTLVEQILSSHPSVGAGQELTFWQANFSAANELIRRADPRLSEIARSYLDLLEGLAPGKRRITDKMPQNFWCLGTIHATFPNARIIHCHRNPLDTCVSIYFTHMRESPDFAHDLENIASIYEIYVEQMAHWRKVLPSSAFLEVDYERLVADQEPVTRQLIEFCGIEWDEACLRPQENSRVVSTPSLWQTRQPVYRSSVERWRRYEPWLGPLKRLEKLA